MFCMLDDNQRPLYKHRDSTGEEAHSGKLEVIRKMYINQLSRGWTCLERQLSSPFDLKL